MMFLYSARGSALCSSNYSLKKCTFLCSGMKLLSMFLASNLLPKMVMMPKVAGTLRQRYAECKATMKVYKRPLPKMALYGYGMSTTSNVMYSVRGFLGVPKDTGSVMAPTGSILFLPKPLRGFDSSLSCFRPKPILSMVAR
jgi:hypothetical protein